MDGLGNLLGTPDLQLVCTNLDFVRGAVFRRQLEITLLGVRYEQRVLAGSCHDLTALGKADHDIVDISPFKSVIHAA